ncbi:MAG: site-specific DNA-methyltransferase [Bacteroidales bacterium]|jgi:DNA modification methylase|nr:site-specific DNA-methyltransferase [Bacteroidales bacterium]
MKEGKLINPNKLPFLQAQILQKIYIDISTNKKTTIEEIASITDYKPESKILRDAIKALTSKGFVSGSIENGYIVPNSRMDLYKSVIKKNDYIHKHYSENILYFRYSNRKKKNNLHIQPTLFAPVYSNNTISQYNNGGVCHRWYNYLEDFPYYLIEEKITEYELDEESLIVEPFAGSGTTNVSSKMFNIKSIGFDANPLMAFISQVKTNWNINIKKFKQEVLRISNKFLENIHNFDNLDIDKDFIEKMPKKELNQWLSIGTQNEVLLLKNCIKTVQDNDIKNLLLLAMSRSALDASFVSFCPGTTFYPFKEKDEFWDIFTDKVIDIYYDLKKLQQLGGNYKESIIINDTCLNASKYIDKNSIDFLITSPPYPNDLEYTRQTRLELYLLDFVSCMEDVQQIKRKMVKGSTKLIYKESNSEEHIKKFTSVRNISELIHEQTKSKNWGFDYPRMIREYFGDMYLCLKEFLPLIKKDGHFLLVVGDQTIKGVYIPVCDILIEMSKELGYSESNKELFRIRRATGHNVNLPEEIVILKK